MTLFFSASFGGVSLGRFSGGLLSVVLSCAGKRVVLSPRFPTAVFILLCFLPNVLSWAFLPLVTLTCSLWVWPYVPISSVCAVSSSLGFFVSFGCLFAFSLRYSLCRIIFFFILCLVSLVLFLLRARCGWAPLRSRLGVRLSIFLCVWLAFLSGSFLIFWPMFLLRLVCLPFLCLSA